MGAEHVQTFTDTNFETSVLKAPGTVLVDFWGERCPACDALAPQLATLATELAGQATIGKLKVEDNPGTTMRYSIRGIPALLLFKDGELVDTMLGFGDARRLRTFVEPHL